MKKLGTLKGTKQGPGLQDLIQYVLTFLSRGQITMSLRIPESKLPLHDTVEQIDSIKDTSGLNRSPAADEHTRASFTLQKK